MSDNETTPSNQADETIKTKQDKVVNDVTASTVSVTAPITAIAATSMAATITDATSTTAANESVTICATIDETPIPDDVKTEVPTPMDNSEEVSMAAVSDINEISTPVESINQPSTSDNIADGGANDGLFEPSVEMMVNDFDDERTLEEEEALAAAESNDPNSELDSLQREGDMPIEELLALYNCVPPAPLGAATTSRRLSSRSRSTRRASRRTISKDASDAAIDDANQKENISANQDKDAKPIEADAKTLTKRDIVIYEVDAAVEQNQKSADKIISAASDRIEQLADANHAKNDVSRIVLDEDDEDDDDEEMEEESHLKKLYPETYKNKDQRLLRATSRPHSEEEGEEEDGDYSPDESIDDYKKTIMVGSEFQAQIPEGLCRYDDALPYENEDKLVWDPSQLNENDIEGYLQKVSIPNANSNGFGDSSSSPNHSPSYGSAISVSQLPCGAHLRDDEQSLYLLLQCGHNTEEALRRRRLNANVPSAVAAAAAATATSGSPGNDPGMSLWSEEECRNFESGLRIYGKDFHAIQQSKVRTRAVGELVQFYYLWKKTERHDVFANKARLEKKKYNLHPGLTDYMDRFLEEQENNGPSGGNAAGGSGSNGANGHLRDRSSSPGVNCLLYNDYKRQRTNNYTTTLTSTVTNATVTSPANVNLKHVSALHDSLPANDVDILTSTQNRNNGSTK